MSFRKCNSATDKAIGLLIIIAITYANNLDTHAFKCLNLVFNMIAVAHDYLMSN